MDVPGDSEYSQFTHPHWQVALPTPWLVLLEAQLSPRALRLASATRPAPGRRAAAESIEIIMVWLGFFVQLHSLKKLKKKLCASVSPYVKI